MNLHQICVLAVLLVSGVPHGVAIPVHDVSDPDMPFQVKITPAFVNRITSQSMTLRCERNINVETRLAEIFRMRLVKQSASGWDLVAEQRDNEASPTVSGNLTAFANVRGDISGVFIEASWNSIGDDSFGVFKCDVTGFDALDDVIVESSSLIEVFEFKNFIHHLISVSKEAQENVEEMKNVTNTEFARLNNKMQGLYQVVKSEQSEVDHSLASIGSRLNSLEAGMENLKDQMKPLKLNMTLDTSSQWPGGYYALLRPRDGCPLDMAFFSGTHTYLKIHAESSQTSSDPVNEYSSSFLDNPAFTSGSNRIIYLEFCEVPKNLNAVRWPQGSFCIHRLTNRPCPSGFSSGFTIVNTEDTQFIGDGRTKVAHGVDDPWLLFCCQNSTDASDPIQLPTSSPFILYRYGGVCQQVQGMSVSDEYIQINTEDDTNQDAIMGKSPDIEQPGNSVLKFNLCYYQKM